mmetsp:Transcript_14256/g.23041  ORF Transcript_14256/g.23041 Transcript_14256/m.23041 type:complete len:108 (+) Transcript_14256:3274-3597(+)
MMVRSLLFLLLCVANCVRLVVHSSAKSVIAAFGSVGLCCSFGEAGPVELFQGAAEESNLLVSDPFEGKDRLVEEFYLFGRSTDSGWSLFYANHFWVYGLILLSSMNL